MSRGHDHKPGSTLVEEPAANVNAVGRTTLAAALAPAAVATSNNTEPTAEPTHLSEGTTPPTNRPMPGQQLGRHVRVASSQPGEGLPTPQRAKFEQSLKADLSSVRVHTGDAANAATKEHAARAFAVGQNIVFGDHGRILGVDTGVNTPVGDASKVVAV